MISKSSYFPNTGCPKSYARFLFVFKIKIGRNFLDTLYTTGHAPKKLFKDLNGAVSYRTVKRWRTVIQETDTIDFLKPSACLRKVCTKAAIEKIKRKSKGGKRISFRKLAFEMDMSFSSAYRILRKDRKMKSYKKTAESLRKDGHEAQRNKFAN